MSNKYWREENGKHVLYFEPFCEEEKIAEITYEEDGGWVYSSELLLAQNEYLGSDDLEMAKRDVEMLILEHYENELNYYQELLDSFKEE